MPSSASQFLNSFVHSSKLFPPNILGYSIGPTIGHGATSIICKAYSPTGSIVAVKILPPSSIQEAKTWSRLSHEHILPLFDFHLSLSHLYLFTLYCPAGSLLDLLRSLPTQSLLQDDAGMIFRQVVRGLRYLHQEAFIVHRDIKLDNILIDEMGSCRIADFGMAVSLLPDQEQDTEPPRYHRNSTSTHSLQPQFQPGSLPYLAPELLLPTSIIRPHPSQDIWALGVLLYALLSGSLPFFDTFEPRLQLKILNGTYTPLQDIGLGAERILKGCLEKNLLSRWSIAMVDDVAWGVGWGREGDHAGADVLDHLKLPSDTPYILPRSKNTKRERSKSLGDSPSPTYRFPPSPLPPPLSRSPSPSPSLSPSPSPLRPTLPLSPIPDIEIMESPQSLVIPEFDTEDVVRGRSARKRTFEEKMEMR